MDEKEYANDNLYQEWDSISKSPPQAIDYQEWLEVEVIKAREQAQYAEKMVKDIVDPIHIFMKDRNIHFDENVDTALLEYAKQLEQRLVLAKWVFIEK